MLALRSAGLTFLLLILTGGIAAFPVSAQIDLPPRSFDEVVAKAQADGTPILLEIYRPSCPYCKRMEEKVYADSTIRSYLSRHFTYARLNSATSTGSHRYANRLFSSSELATAFGTETVPNTVFFQADGTPIVRQPGYIDRSTFLHLLRYIESNAYETQGFSAFTEGPSE